MRTFSGILALMGALLICFWLVPASPASDQRTPREEVAAAGSGLQQFAGTFWTVFVTDVGLLPAVLSFTAEGTFTSVDGSDEGVGGAFDVNSPMLGVFERTASHQTFNRGLYIAYQGGIPVEAVVITGFADWSADYSGGTGMVEQRLYDLTIGENPLDPNQGTPGDAFPFQFARLTP